MPDVQYVKAAVREHNLRTLSPLVAYTFPQRVAIENPGSSVSAEVILIFDHRLAGF